MALSLAVAGTASAQEFGVLNAVQGGAGPGQGCTFQPSAYAPTCTTVDGAAVMTTGGGTVVVTTRSDATLGGPLRASSQIEVTNGDLDIARAFGRAGYYDALNIGSSDAVFAEFMVSGEGVGGFTAGADNPLSNSYGIFFIGNFGTASVPGNYGVNPNPPVGQFQIPPDGVTRTGVIRVPLSLGTNNLLFGFSAVTFLGRPVDAPPTWSATAYTDFMSTAQVTGLTLLDAEGRDVTDEVSWSFASGTTYSTVPEPGTWALLGTGLLGLAGVGRLRRQRAG